LDDYQKSFYGGPQVSARAAVVTGGGSGQGLAIARRLAGRGLSLLICGNDCGVLDSAREEIASLAGGRCETLTCDLTDPATPSEMVQAAVAAFRRLDVLVNNAGIWETSLWGSMTVQGWDRSMNLMARAPMLAMQAAVGPLEQVGGRIVNNASIGARLSELGSAHYSAAKAALVSLTESAAVDLAPRGIRVNAIAPGWIRSAMSESYLSSLDAAGTARLNPLGRAGEPDEVASVVEYLALDAPDFVTGTTIYVDGGQHALMVTPQVGDDD
jgi:NAD(P)-dependent dehydrogenase (short-subunit alcohol dehydrogenase family)